MRSEIETYLRRGMRLTADYRIDHEHLRREQLVQPVETAEVEAVR